MTTALPTATTADAEPARPADTEPVRPSAPVLTVGLGAQRVRRALAGGLPVLLVLDLLAAVTAGLDLLPASVTRFFDSDQKVNVPTGFKVTALLLGVLLLAARAAVARRWGQPLVRSWVLMTVLVAFAWVDETTYLHQTVSRVASRHLDLGGGFFGYAWPFLYLPFVVVFGVFVVRFLLRIRRRLAGRLLAVAVLYVGGSLGIEPVKALIRSQYDGGIGSLQYRLGSWVSDSLEMIGLALLVTTLLAELARVVGAVEVRVAEPGRD